MNRRLGTTLIELLVAVTFLSIGAAIILECVSQMGGNMNYSERRILAMKYAQSQLDAVRSTALSTALTPGTTTSLSTVNSMVGQMTTTQTISLVSGFTSLYSVTETCSWTEAPEQGVTRSDSFTITSYMEGPDD